MITTEQILLLEKKVESALEKIARLKEENANLQKKCQNLSSALEEKTKRLSEFGADQGKIEEGILKVLDRLNAVENDVLQAASQALSSKSNAQQNPNEGVQIVPAQEMQNPSQNIAPVQQTQNAEISANSSQQVQTENVDGANFLQEPEIAESESGKVSTFDIFY